MTKKINQSNKTSIRTQLKPLKDYLCMLNQNIIQFTCPICQHEFLKSCPYIVDGDDEKNHNLIFNNQFRLVTCPKCTYIADDQQVFIYISIKNNFAVWFSPQHSIIPIISKQTISKIFGSKHYLSKAKITSTWSELKRTIKIHELKNKLLNRFKFPNSNINNIEQNNDMDFLDKIAQQIYEKMKPD